MSKALEILKRYEEGEAWFTALAEYETTILEDFAKTCYQKMLNSFGYGTKGGITQLEDAYPHLIIAHAFMEFLHTIGFGRFIGSPNSEAEAVRKVYDGFCEVNLVPQQLIEKGWQEYLND